MYRLNISKYTIQISFKCNVKGQQDINEKQNQNLTF